MCEHKPFASLNTRRSLANSSGDVFSFTPNAPVTKRLANAAQVSGRCRYGCNELEHFLALDRDSAVASVNGFITTNGRFTDNTSAAD